MSKKQAQKFNADGLAHYKAWQLEDAITAFQDAVKADGTVAEYPLNLARACARAGRYDQVMEALGSYLHLETDTAASTRYQRIFSSAADDVETLLVDTMSKMKLPMKQIGKGLQMWLEYRIAIGEQPLRVPKPELWAGGITYAILKVNFDEDHAPRVAKAFDISQRAIRDKYHELVEALDLMPADYRYFTGDENPLDKLVEAAQLLETMDEKFKE